MSYFVPLIVLDPHIYSFPESSQIFVFWSKSRIISPIDSRQSGLFRGLYKYRYLSNASTVCDGIFTIYSQDNTNYDHFLIIFKSYTDMEKSVSESQ